MGIEKLKYIIDKLNNEIKDQRNLLREYEKKIGDYKNILLQKDGKMKEYFDILNLLYNSARKKIYQNEVMSYPRLRSLIMNKNKKIENIIYDNFADNINSETNLDHFYNFKKVQNMIDIKFDSILQRLVKDICPPHTSDFLKLKPRQSFVLDNKDFDDWKKDLRKTYCFYKMKNFL